MPSLTTLPQHRLPQCRNQPSSTSTGPRQHNSSLPLSRAARELRKCRPLIVSGSRTEQRVTVNPRMRPRGRRQLLGRRPWSTTKHQSLPGRKPHCQATINHSRYGMFSSPHPRLRTPERMPAPCVDKTTSPPRTIAAIYLATTGPSFTPHLWWLHPSSLDDT